MKIDTYQHLIKKLSKNNDQKALKELYHLFFDRLFAFSLRYVKSREVAEEVISDVFLKVWKNRSKLPEISNLETFLYISVRNQSINYIKGKVANHNKLYSLNEPMDFQFLVNQFTPEDAYLGEELKNILDGLVNELSPACKNAFLLVKEDGLDYKEAGKVLEVSPFTVKNQVLKAVKVLREGLIQKFTQEEKKEGRMRRLKLHWIAFPITLFQVFQLFFE